MYKFLLTKSKYAVASLCYMQCQLGWQHRQHQSSAAYLDIMKKENKNIHETYEKVNDICL